MRWPQFTLNRQRLLLVGAVGCVALLALDRLLLTPLIDGWRQRAAGIQRLRGEVSQAGAILEQEGRWLRWRQEAAARLLPAGTGEAESLLLGRVDAWARESGLTVSSLRPNWREAERGEPPRLELSVAGTGGMAAIAGFLHHLETGPVAVAVEQVQISPTRQDGVLGVEVRLSGLCRTGAATTQGKGPRA